VTAFKFGLIHAPVTPFADGHIDFATYANVIDFHLTCGAEGLALPMHVGESVSLTVTEREALLEFAVKQVKGRIPIVAHVSEAGTEIAASLATHAAKAGAAAVIAAVPYYWTPPQHMLVEHFGTIGEAAQIPLFVFNSPAEMNEVEIASKSVVDLLHRLPNMVGLIDLSLDWQYMIEVITVARAERPDFQLVSGTEYMISAAAIGATGMLSSLSGIAPTLIGKLYALCMAEKFTEARPAQEQAAILFRALRDAGVAGLKAGLRALDRDCGAPRPPLTGLNDADAKSLLAEISSAGVIGSELRGWAKMQDLIPA
jgi:4-hydroxy-tetrahydrodipicolinate synthase